MPNRKRKGIGQVQSAAKKLKTKRKNETPEERHTRLKRIRDCLSKSNANESAQQHEARLKDMRERATTSRASESVEERELRLQNERVRTATSRAAESLEERQARLDDMNESVRRSRKTIYDSLLLKGLNYESHEDYSQHPSVLIGKMDLICPHCQARKFKFESSGMCCNNGKVKLSILERPPQDLLSYTSGDTPESKHFLSNIRKYNSCFQMTSFGASSVVEHPGFPSTFTVQGQIYHKAGSLLPPLDRPHKFLQLYFIGDEKVETDQRCTYIPGTRNEIVLTLQRMFHEHNKLVQAFKTALESMPTDDYKIIIRADRRPAGEHERRFNAPQASEVAVLITGEEFNQRDIVIQRRGESLRRIVETHPSYDPLQYPVIFPYGEDGYHFNLWQVNPATGQSTSKKVSAMDFYAYRIMVRESEQNHILNCRQLFHQFIVDMYAKIESERLLYIRLNQRKLRVEEYVHLKDAVANEGDIQNFGALVILPATFTGSPRHMHEYTQDAMTYVRTYGRPDLFITFTCNPAWTEIKENLTRGQSSNERHDLLARVFKLKQMKLIDVIIKGHVFGETRCWMYTIEWQKRGLPHSHNLIWLANKIQPNQIDNVISAELPDPSEDPLLFAVVMKNMIHGPCGNLNRNSPCMKDGHCTKKYPRTMLLETQTGNDGYPLYRRRAPEYGGFTARIKIRGNLELEVDNRWIVPYSPFLSKMFKAHINVEYCNSVQSIKYVCKYVNKGSDMAVFGVGSDSINDEVLRYQLGRYLSSNEAVWRTLRFSIHERHPTVVHLSVHLENGQRVYFTSETAAKVAVQPPNTTLTAFFDLCRQDEFARTLLYPELPRYYTWNTSRKVFCRRKVGKRIPDHHVFASDALGRVYTVHPNNAECYFLRMLLHTVRGPRSFAELKTVNGELCQTFRDACHKLGLLEGDQHWDNTLKEAVLISLPSQIRNLFAIILTTCNPSNPLTLWDKYKQALSEDILSNVRRENPSMEIDYGPSIFNKALLILEDNCIAMSNKSIVQLGLPAPERDRQDLFEAEYIREKNYDVQELTAYVTDKKPRLNSDQRSAYEKITQQIEKGQGGIIFLNASGGTGKTFLINLILAEVRANGDIALAVASSGIAATLMQGGRTAHSAFKLPLDVGKQENPICKISKTIGKAKVLRACKLIVWDECTMAHKKGLEALDATLKDLRGNDRIMGGVLLLLCGDFRQTLPVIPRSTPADEMYACLKYSTLWRQVKSLTLTDNMRVSLGDGSDELFPAKLLEIGDGRANVDSFGDIKLTPDLCKLTTSVTDLIDAVYPAIVNNFNNLDWLRERAILAAKNDDVGEINTRILNMLPCAESEYKSIDTVVEDDDVVNFPIEFLNSLDPSGFPPHRLLLKVGAPILLLRNLDPPKLCNGTRLCVTKMLKNVIEATILTGSGQGDRVFIPRIPLISTDLPFNFKRLQYPIRLAFSMTINKSQGQSIKYCGVDLRTPCFSHGQLYVACSRVGSPRNLFILAPGGSTKNIVYKQVLN